MPAAEPIFAGGRRSAPSGLGFGDILRVTADSGQNALKALLLMNGSAAIAILGFLTHLAASEEVNQAQVALLGGALKWLLVGVFASVLAYGVTYLSNVTQSFGLLLDKRWMVAGYVFMAFAIIFACVGLATFLFGGWSAANALTLMAG